MTGNTENEPSAAEKGIDAAKEAVYAASEHVENVGQHLKDKIEAVKRPDIYVQMLKDVTKAAPLGMLAVAFIGGMIFARRRD